MSSAQARGPRWWLRQLTLVALTCATAGYLAVMGWLVWNERQLVFQPTRRLTPPLASLQLVEVSGRHVYPNVHDEEYALLDAGHAREALTVFQLNAALFPDSWSTHDGLGDAYTALHDDHRAIDAYRRSLALGAGAGNVSHDKLERLVSRQHGWRSWLW